MHIKITVKTRDRMGTYSLPSHVLGTVLAAENFTLSSTTGDTCPGAVAARGLMIGVNERDNNRVNDRVHYESYKMNDRVKVQQHERAFGGWSLRQASAHDHTLRPICKRLYVLSLSVCSLSCWLTLGLTGSQLHNRLRDQFTVLFSRAGQKVGWSLFIRASLSEPHT